MAHIKLCEPINIGCMVYVKELQEMAIRNHANRECSLRKNPVLNHITNFIKGELKEDYLGYLFGYVESQETIESIA